MSRRIDNDGCDTKVTYLGNGLYGCRVFLEGRLHDEGVAEGRSQIRPVLRDLLRWVDKMGWMSKMADRSRHRDGEKIIARRMKLKVEK